MKKCNHPYSEPTQPVISLANPSIALDVPPYAPKVQPAMTALGLTYHPPQPAILTSFSRWDMPISYRDGKYFQSIVRCPATCQTPLKHFSHVSYPPMAVLIFATVGVLTGSLPARVLLSVITVWIVAAIWAYFDHRCRQSRRRTRRGDSSFDKTLENSAPD